MSNKSSQTYNPKYAIIIAMTISALGLVYGYDTGNISGALPYLKKDFHLSTTMAEFVSSAVVVGSIVGAIFGGRMSNALGRKKTMLNVSLGFVVFAALSAFAPSVWWLIIIRFFLGISIGVTIVVAPVFIAEFSPSKIRGALLVTFQVATTIGIASASFINFGLSQSGNWRAMLGVSAILAMLLAIAIFRFPDTPRWYVMNGQKDKALQVLRKIEPPENIQNELSNIDQELNSKEHGVFSELFKSKYLKGTIFILGLGFFVQITGINAIVYYGPIIFQHVGFLDASSGILITGLTQLVAFLAEISSTFIIDRWGRRKSLLMGIGFMILANIVLAILFFVGFFASWMMYLAVVGIFIFRVGYSFGFGSLVWVYASETLPSRLRSLGSSVVLTIDLLANFIVSMFFLTALNALGGGITFGAFFVLAAIAWVFVFRLAPETKGRSLEEIQSYWDNGGHWPEDSDKTK